MKTSTLSRLFMLAGVALTLAGATLVLAQRTALAGPSGQQADPEPFHPSFALLDDDGENVLATGAPVSTMRTCGACHDTDFILGHSYHADAGLSALGDPGSVDGGRSWDTGPGDFGRWNPLEYRYLSPPGDGLPDLTTPEWLILYGAGHIGGGPAQFSRDGSPLASLEPGSSVEAQLRDPATGDLLPWDWSASGIVEMNCFLCHLEAPDLAARAGALSAGEFGWANTATLAQTGIVAAAAGGYRYAPSAFGEDGELLPAFVLVQDPTNRNCGACHGVVHTNPDIPLTTADIDAWRTSTTGQIVSPQRISDSGLNLADKAALQRSWDIHAERVVACTGCHFSLNNPAYSGVAPDEQLEHLQFDPRRMDIGAYLERPDHNFARGAGTQSGIAPELAGTMRRCEACHDSAVSHDWLPYSDRHMAALSCETCHIPAMYAPATQQIDWTVLTLAGEPAVSYRGVADPGAELPLLTGFEPVLLPSTDVDGQTRLAPFNLVTSFYWIYGPEEDARPVRLADLQEAWLNGGDYPAEVLAVFDADGDGGLDAAELRIDTEEKERLIAARLEALGLEAPRIMGDVQPFGIHHDVAGGEWATRECRSCHGEDSRITRPVELAGYIPGGELPGFTTGGAGGVVYLDEGGSLYYAPVTAEQDLYILGRDSVGWVDGLGLGAFLAVLAGVTVHGGLRAAAARKQAIEETEPEIREIYMYSAYERFWHWLQTATILMLLFTGLIIHKPDTFGIFSFAYVVLVHNLLAAVLVLNASLSLFYHIVSGEIRQYLPRPRGFFDDAIVQARFYLKGIFRGEPHPFEKTPGRKLNPLQQVTYFGILNVLLPLQVLTGALMWGAQRWPDLADMLGGLRFLGPFHSLIAWMFAAFIVAHVYLTTTGPYPAAGIKAMLHGWDEIEVHPQGVGEQEAAPAD